MTGTVRRPSAADEAWTELAKELTPSKSLARVDTVTARTVTTVTVVGVLLTGLGVISLSLPAQISSIRMLAAATVSVAALAVGSALAAQVLSISRHLNPSNRIEVKAWYRRQFRTRAYPTQAATVLLLLAALLAGATASTALLTNQGTAPTVTMTQTFVASSLGNAASTGQVTVTVIFRSLAPGQVVTVALITTDRILSRAVATPAPDGTATIAVSASHLAGSQRVTLTANTITISCQAVLPSYIRQPTLTCHSR